MRGGGHSRVASRGRNASELQHEAGIRTPASVLPLGTVHSRDAEQRKVGRGGADGGGDGARRRA